MVASGRLGLRNQWNGWHQRESGLVVCQREIKGRCQLGAWTPPDAEPPTSVWAVAPDGGPALQEHNSETKGLLKVLEGSRR